MAFTHLHLHTEYSLLDGAAKIKRVVGRAKELGMTSIAITDHGNMFGVIDFYKECLSQGIKPVIGCEVYMAARTMHDRDQEVDRHHNHLLLLAENNEGYHNLVKIVSAGYKEGFHYKPRVDKDLLRRYSKGIIATSACLVGKVQRHLLNRDYEGAKNEALELQDIFGRGNFFLEIQDQGLEDEAAINSGIIRLSRELDIPLVATNDVHYVTREDAEMHDVLLAIQTATTLDDEKRMRFPNDEFYFKSEEEMRSIFSHIPEACDNTQVIADRCNVTFTFGEYHLPEYTPPEGFTNREYLRFLCEKGLKERFPEITEELRDRLEFELGTIESMGFVEYFLIVWDFINFAKTNGIIVGPGRGSAAGSIVSYSLGITNINPIKYNLIFERFLNPERISMPDIDIDFCVDRRGEVIEYVRNKYGSDNVSQIITFGTMKARLAVRDVGRALGVPRMEIDKIAKSIPADGRTSLQDALVASETLKEMYQGDPLIKKLLDTAMKVEGFPRNTSTHAAGVVISKLPIDEYVPLYYGDKGLSTQFTMGTLEELGLLKMDFLGLRNLDVIRDAIEMVKENYGVEINFDEMGYEVPEVYEMIAEGDTMGVFQLESGGMTSFMKNLKPTCFEDVVAGIALYRPGPMQSIPTYLENKKDPSKIKYITPELAPILDVTYGCIIYQEQVMQIVRQLAGYSYGRSDLVRRAMSKKKHDVMEEERQWFIYGKEAADGEDGVPGCVANGISEKAASEIFDEMVSFAEYAFNKSHAAAYAIVAFQTGYMKRFYPLEYMAALLTSVMSKATEVTKYLNYCKQVGIKVLPPSVHHSYSEFVVEGDSIRYGLVALKDVGAEAINAIVKAREEKGLPKDIFSFVDMVDTTAVNKKALESLIKSGAMDCLNPNRAAHLAVLESLLEAKHKKSKSVLEGQVSLFDVAGETLNTESNTMKLPEVENFDQRTLLELEKEMAKVYITGHPLDSYTEKINKVTSLDLGALDITGSDDQEEGAVMDGPRNRRGEELHDGDKVVIACMITNRKKLTTRNNQLMEFLDVEDMTGVGSVIVFPNTYRKYSDILQENKVLVVNGSLNFGDDENPKIIADTITDIDALEIGRDDVPPMFMDSPAPAPLKPEPSRGISSDAVKIRIPEEGDKLGVAGELDEKDALDKVVEILKKYPGNNQILIYKRNGKIISPERGVAPTLDFAEEMALLVGNPNIKIKTIAR